LRTGLLRRPREIVAGTSGKAKLYSSGNRGMKKLPGPQGTGASGFPVASLIMTHLVLIKMDEKLFSLDVIPLLLRIFFEHFLQTIRNASFVKFVTPFLINK